MSSPAALEAARQQKRHAERLRKVKSSIDNSAPRSFSLPHLKSNAKKRQLARDRRRRIDYENRMLLDKLCDIINHPSNVSQNREYERIRNKHHAAKTYVRVRRMEALAQSNKIHAMRIMQSGPTYYQSPKAGDGPDADAWGSPASPSPDSPGEVPSPGAHEQLYPVPLSPVKGPPGAFGQSPGGYSSSSAADSPAGASGYSASDSVLKLAGPPRAMGGPPREQGRRRRRRRRRRGPDA